MPLDRTRHPCFDADARHQFGRVHLPVAPACNVQCNFCDRKYDCPNESGCLYGHGESNLICCHTKHLIHARLDIINQRYRNSLSSLSRLKK